MKCIKIQKNMKHVKWQMKNFINLIVVFVAINFGGAVWALDDPRGLLIERTAKWEQEADLENDKETFGAERNPTGNPIGGGEGYNNIITKGDHSVNTIEKLRAVLENVKEGQVVFISGNVELDMTDRKPLMIPAGVTLASTRGYNGSQGALIYSNTQGVLGLLRTAGDCVRITGLRIMGPHSQRSQVPVSYGIFSSHFSFEVDNCEVTAFSFAGIVLRDGANRTYIHHNFIHHNQMDGLGYGVSIDRSYALIEANIFDWCRHYICGANGTPGTGYEARYNICRPNASRHLFDMHGEANGSGIAGDWINIHHNTFMCTEQISIGIRATPSQGAKIDHNWFYNSDPCRAVFVIASAFGTNKRNFAMRSIGDQSLGNSRAYKNLYGLERKLVSKEEMIKTRIRYTRSNVLKLSKEDLLHVVVAQREQIKALNTREEKRGCLEPIVVDMSKGELIDVVLSQLKHIISLDILPVEEAQN